MGNTSNIITMRGNDGGIIKLEYHDSLPSTVALARGYAAKGYPDRYVVFTENMNNEDGESECGICMSILLRPSIFSSQASLLGAMSAAAMVSALQEHTVHPLGLGWVSDLYCNGVKIGHSSLEGKLDSFTSYEYIIVNYCIKTSKKNFPPRLTDMIRKVFEADNTSVNMIMAKTILLRFFSMYANLKTSSKFMDIYSEKLILRGIKIKYDDGQKKRSCRVLSVDSKTGALIIEGRGGKPIHVTSPSNVQIPKRIKVKHKA